MKASPDSQDQGGRTAASYCAELGYTAHLRLLIELGAFLDQPENDGSTPLHWAARTGQADLIRMILQAGHGDCNRLDKSGWAPLSLAIERGHEAVVRLLLDKGADIELKGKGQMPLLWAAEQG